MGAGGDYFLDLLVFGRDGRMHSHQVLTNQDPKGFLAVRFQVLTAVAEYRTYGHKLLLSLSQKEHHINLSYSGPFRIPRYKKC